MLKSSLPIIILKSDVPPKNVRHDHNFSPFFFLLFLFLLYSLLLLTDIYIPLPKIHEIDSSRTFLPHMQNQRGCSRSFYQSVRDILKYKQQEITISRDQDHGSNTPTAKYLLYYLVINHIHNKLTLLSDPNRL